MTCGQSVDFGTWQRCARARVAHGWPRIPDSRESCWTARAPTAAAGWWSSTTAPPPPPTCTTPMPSWAPPGSPTTSRRRPAPICRGSTPARRRSCRPATPSIPAAGRRSTPAPCARCGSRRATGSPSSRAASCWPSSRAGPTCPGGCPGTAGTSWARRPFGWSLDDAMEGLGPRADRATAFWRWRQREDSWAGFQQSMLGHLLARLGPGARYWDVGSGKLPPVGVSERPPTGSGPYTVLSTLGMSCQRMPVVEQVMEDPSGCARIELAIATTMPSPEAARDLPVAGPVPVAGRHLVRGRAQHPLVPRARHVPAGRGERGGAPAGRPRPADRPGGAGPVRVRLRRGARCGGSGSCRSPSGSGSWPRSAARRA